MTDKEAEALIERIERGRMGYRELAQAAIDAIRALVAEREGLLGDLVRIKDLVDPSSNADWKDERNTDWSRGRILAIVDAALQASKEPPR